MKQYIIPKLNIQRFGAEPVITGSAELVDNWNETNSFNAKTISWTDRAKMKQVQTVISFSD